MPISFINLPSRNSLSRNDGSSELESYKDFESDDGSCIWCTHTPQYAIKQVNITIFKEDSNPFLGQSADKIIKVNVPNFSFHY